MTHLLNVTKLFPSIAWLQAWGCTVSGKFWVAGPKASYIYSRPNVFLGSGSIYYGRGLHSFLPGHSPTPQLLQVFAARHSELYPSLQNELHWQEPPPWGCLEDCTLSHRSDAHAMSKWCVCLSAQSPFLVVGKLAGTTNSPEILVGSVVARLVQKPHLCLAFCLPLFSFPHPFVSFSAFLHSISHLPRERREANVRRLSFILTLRFELSMVDFHFVWFFSSGWTSQKCNRKWF